ncbi:MAG TPA: S53 family peptidase [Solirubrobacterales bacterium]|nr:S53 family peptidase [Solirubrobacterales bacterium]
MRPPARLVAFLLGLLALAAAPADAVAASGGVPVGAPPRLPAGATVAGTVAPEQKLDLYVALRPRDPVALEAFAEEVATPGSPVYGDYLSVPAFAARFGATTAQLATVRAALAERGLTVGTPSANHLSLPVTATVAQAEAAFATPIDRVRTASGGLAFANRSAPRIPAVAAPFVQGVLGLDDLQESHRSTARRETNPLASAATTPPAATSAVATGGPQPCAEAIATAEHEHGYTADQIATAYELAGFYRAGNFGAGQTVALLELEPFLPADIETFQTCYGTDVEVSEVNVGHGPGPYVNEDGEAALDIEQLISLAPGARIVVYQAKNEGDNEARILSAYVTQDTAKVMSSSWGICEEEEGETAMATMDTLLQEAAAQGQSFFVAAGDWGSTDCYEEESEDFNENLQVDFPGSDPWATDVGGTRMVEPTSPSPIDYLWNEAPEWGAGGSGRSEHFPMPAYQSGAAPGLGVIGALSSGEPCGATSGYCRQVPDVAADASLQTGYAIRANERWEVTGGTSAAAPFWAAFAALTNASPTCGGTAIGFANPALYEVGGSDAYATDFRDVVEPRPGGKPTTNRFDDAEPFPAGPGYDMASGIGTPRGTSLAASLCALLHPPAPPAPPAPPTPSAPTTPAAPTTSPPPTPTAKPAPARVLHARLSGIGHARPRLSVTLAARASARITALTITLPHGLTTAHAGAIKAGIVVRDAARKPLHIRGRATAQTIHIHLPARPRVTVTIRPSALLASPKLVKRARAGDGRSLRFVVNTRESGARSSRFLLSLGL